MTACRYSLLSLRLCREVSGGPKSVINSSFRSFLYHHSAAYGSVSKNSSSLFLNNFVSKPILLKPQCNLQLARHLSNMVVSILGVLSDLNYLRAFRFQQKKKAVLIGAFEGPNKDSFTFTQSGAKINAALGSDLEKKINM